MSFAIICYSKLDLKAIMSQYEITSLSDLKYYIEQIKVIKRFADAALLLCPCIDFVLQ